MVEHPAWPSPSIPAASSMPVMTVMDVGHPVLLDAVAGEPSPMAMLLMCVAHGMFLDAVSMYLGFRYIET